MIYAVTTNKSWEWQDVEKKSITSQIGLLRQNPKSWTKLQSAEFEKLIACDKEILVFVVEQKSLWRKRLIVGTRCEVCPPFYLKSLMLPD